MSKSNNGFDIWRNKTLHAIYKLSSADPDSMTPEQLMFVQELRTLLVDNESVWQTRQPQPNPHVQLIERCIARGNMTRDEWDQLPRKWRYYMILRYKLQAPHVELDEASNEFVTVKFTP
jgi:hypothetical protein